MLLLTTQYDNHVQENITLCWVKSSGTNFESNILSNFLWLTNYIADIWHQFFLIRVNIFLVYFKKNRWNDPLSWHWRDFNFILSDTPTYHLNLWEAIFTRLFFNIIVLNLKSQHAILKSNLLVAFFWRCYYSTYYGSGLWTSSSIKI